MKLILLTLWPSSQIRARAIANLTPLIVNKDVCGNILLAKKYGVRQWLIDGYINLVVQLTLPILDELCATGIDPMTLARIYYIRNALPPLISAGYHACTRCGQRCLAPVGSAIPHNCRTISYLCVGIGNAFCTGRVNPSEIEKEAYRKSALPRVLEVFSSELVQLEVWCWNIILCSESDGKTVTHFCSRVCYHEQNIMYTPVPDIFHSMYLSHIYEFFIWSSSTTLRNRILYILEYNTYCFGTTEIFIQTLTCLCST